MEKEDEADVALLRRSAPYGWSFGDVPKAGGAAGGREGQGLLGPDAALLRGGEGQHKAPKGPKRGFRSCLRATPNRYLR